ncbi:hypothetical protein EJV47_08920 [Hymenobacter gummosus]|uniref:STAS/SEC14 domain-containing protein n=1 Tax=Hymenobacter gummosus TaxID=1776032 RepID=A0A3S0H674_9BACT|nr:hypothetical protein [Hymenobacter gummosus]RTQ50740.1 hypothetical protein EJV47_08920 [Hymenobacter gummosus]
MRLPSPSPLAELSYRPDLGILVVRWLGATTDDEIRRLYGYLEHANIPRCRFWLLDARRRPSSSPVITRWVFDEFAPHLARQLGGRLYFSYLISPLHLVDADDFRRLEESRCNALPYALHYASQEGEATDWLLKAQREEQLAATV